MHHGWFNWGFQDCQFDCWGSISKSSLSIPKSWINLLTWMFCIDLIRCHSIIRRIVSILSQNSCIDTILTLILVNKYVSIIMKNYINQGKTDNKFKFILGLYLIFFGVGIEFLGMSSWYLYQLFHLQLTFKQSSESHH